MTFGRPSLLAVLALLALSGAASAQVAPEPGSATPPGAPAERQTPEPAQTGAGTQGFWERDKALGSIGGVRTGLDQYGISLGLLETDEVLGNVTGGRRTGAVYEGLTTASVDVDLEKAIGLAGGTVRVSAFQIHGRGLSGNNVGNLNAISSIEATRATRLFELWYQQAFLGGRLDIKLGQQSADLEFATSTYAGLFVNASFGWPTLFAVDLPAGGPSYPLAALGARLRVRPAEPLTLLLGMFNGSPSAPGDGDPQGRRNPSGTGFRLSDGVFVIGEAQYAINGGEGAPGLPGTYKVGAWYNSNAFASPFSADVRAARGNWSVYAVADQLVWRPAGARDGGIGVFVRAMGAPGDRNQVNVFVDAGATYKGVFGRDNDTVGLGVGWARISGTARAGDAAAGLATVRSSEAVLELSYQAQLAPWLQVQPLFQYVFNPGGGIPNPDRPQKRLGDAAVFGVRSTITF